MPLDPGQHADCVRCGSEIARSRPRGADRALAWSVAGLALAIPSMMLPLATVDRLGLRNEGLWISGVQTMWQGRMPELGASVLAFGWLAPVVLLAAVAVALWLEKRPGVSADRARAFLRVAHACEHWSMAEVYLLAVLVAFIKLDALVNVVVGPGLWCYAGMAFALVKALRNIDLAERLEAGRGPVGEDAA